MKPGAHLKLLPRSTTQAARRKLSTATAYTTQSSPLYFDVLPQTSQPSGSSSTQSGGPSSSPRILKGPSQPTTALTPYSPPPTHSGSSSTSTIAHPRYTTNSSHAYPGGNGLPLVWFVPTSTNSGRSEIERRLPWEGPSEGKGKERRTFSLEMGAYGIPKRRKTQQSQERQSSDEQQQHVRLSASAPTSSSSLSTSSGASKEDPAAYSLSVQVGEDAYFLRPDALGVADGVGGWKHKGESNSALFAKKLMHFCSYELARQQQQDPSYPTPPPSSASTPSSSTANSSPPPTSGPDPVQILQTSYERCIHDAKQSGMLGSSTATLAVLAESELRIAHVGDCVVCVVRDGEMVFRSEEMQHSFNYPYQLGPRSDTTPATHAQRLTVPVKANDIVILASDGMGDNLWDEDVVDEINRFIRTSPLSTSPSQTGGAGGSLSFSASSTTSSQSPPASHLRNAHAPAGPVTNTVLAQRLSEALASRAKRVSERRAMTADASGTMGAFAPKGMRIPPPPKGPPPPPPTSTRPGSTSAPMPIPPRPAAAAPVVPLASASQVTQTPTPPPSPLLKPIPVVEGMELPIHRSITQSDGQLDDDFVLGDGFGGDGEYGGAGLGGVGWPVEEEEEPEWVRDEIPFGRRAREAGVRFVGGKGDDISVLVAIISSVPEPSAEPPQPAPAYQPIRSSSSAAIDALAKLRLNSTR